MRTSSACVRSSVLGSAQSSSMPQPLVSVIVIFFNEATFIRAALESVLAQSYCNWELLLVDDGSSDESAAIAQTYAQQHPTQIRYLTHPNRENRGMSATRNLGLAEAKGDYITFLDADDIMLPAKLTEQVEILLDNPDVALVCGRTQWWYSWTDNREDRSRDFTPATRLPLAQPIAPPQVLMQFLEDEWTSLCDLMVRRDAVETVGGYEDSFRGMYEDQVFHAKLCLHYQVWMADTCWYRYRQHPQSCCAIADGQGWLKSRKTFLEWLERYLSQHPQVPRTLWRAVQRELWRYRAPILFRVRNRVQQLRSLIPS